MGNSTCKVEGESHSSGYLRHGMCEKHYARWVDTGSPLPVFEFSCVECEEIFSARRRGVKYCSEGCKRSARVKRSKHSCVECGKPILLSSTSSPDGVVRCNTCRLVHGSPGMYRKGCRCDVCVSGQSERNREYLEAFRDEHGENPNTRSRRRFRELHGYRPTVGSTGWISPKLRRELYERDRWVCHLCGDQVDPTLDPNSNKFPSLDHIIPRSKGGSDDPLNLKTACRICNSIRQDKPIPV